MVSTGKDWDIKLTLGSTDHKLRLLQQNGRKQWTVAETPPNPRIDSEAASREGFRPDQELPFVMETWDHGIGLDRFFTGSQERGFLNRYADGFGIDTSEPGVVKHGPLETSVGSLASGQKPLEFILFKNKVYARTNNRLYAIESGAPVSKHDFSPEITSSFVIFNDFLYISLSTTDTYARWDGTTMVTPQLHNSG